MSEAGHQNISIANDFFILFGVKTQVILFDGQNSPYIFLLVFVRLFADHAVEYFLSRRVGAEEGAKETNISED